MAAVPADAVKAGAWEPLEAIAETAGCEVREVLRWQLLAPGDSVSDWMGIALGRSGLEVDSSVYLTELEGYVTRKYAQEGGLHTIKATEWHRISLTVLTLGGDPTAFGKDADGNTVNLIADGTYGWRQSQSLGTQGLNGWIFALITMDAMCYAIPDGAAYTRGTIIEAILSAQETNGGFGLAAGAADVDITAMALQALAPYQNGNVTYSLPGGGETTVAQAVDRALHWLSGQQTENGDFSNWGETNAESTAQVIIALCSLGIVPGDDARFCKNGISPVDGLLRYRESSGMFRHTLDGGADVMATEQAALALMALERLENGQRRLYDLREEPTEEVRAQIGKLNENLHQLTDAELSRQAEELYARYLAVPAEERSYVTGYGRLAACMERLGSAVTPEDPGMAYGLYQGGGTEDAGMPLWLYAVICVAAAAAIVAAAIIRRGKKQNV